MVKKFYLLILVTLCIALFPVKAAPTYTITLNFDEEKATVVGELEYEVGELIFLDVIPEEGFELNYWFWDSSEFVGPPQIKYDFPIQMIMPNFDITIHIYFIDDLSNYQQYSFEIGGANLNPVLFPDIFKISLSPSQLFTFGRLSQAIIMIQTDCLEEEYEVFLMEGFPRPPFSSYRIGQRDTSFVLSHASQNPLIELYYDTTIILPTIILEQGDVIVRFGEYPNITGCEMHIFLPLEDTTEIDFGDQGLPNVLDGMQTLLIYFGLWNNSGFLIIFTLIFVALVVSMLLMGIPNMAIIIVVVSLISIFTFMNLLPIWAWMILFAIVLLYLFSIIREGFGGASDE